MHNQNIDTFNANMMYSMINSECSMNLDRILHDVSLTASHSVKLRKLNSMQFLNSMLYCLQFIYCMIYCMCALLECLRVSGYEIK